MSQVTFSYSIITSQNPEVLTKGYILKEGTVDKLPHGLLFKGEVIIPRRQTFAQFVDKLQDKPDYSKAFVYGTLAAPRRKAEIVVQKDLHKHKGNTDIISRTRDYFSFEQGPGIMMLDYDPPKDGEPLEKNELLQSIYKICPAIKDAPHVLTASASSFIYNGDEQIWGTKGWRIHILVADASHIQTAGETFYERSWLQGFGYYHVGENGSCHHRSLIDRAVFRPEGLDYVYGAYCVPPLRQQRPAPEAFNVDASPLDTRSNLPALSDDERAQYRLLKNGAKKNVKEIARPLQEQATREAVDKAFYDLPQDQQTEEKRQEMIKAYKNALLTKTLPGYFILHPQAGGTVTVSEILADLEKWHDQRFADPFEPDYRNDNRIAWLNAYGHNGPCIYSHAHGKQIYSLSPKHSINIDKSKRPEQADEALTALRRSGRIFQRGGEVVFVAQDGTILPQDKEGIQLLLDEYMNWNEWKKGKWKRTDAPMKIATAVKAKKGRLSLPVLSRVITAPTIVPEDGRLIQQEGYDLATGIFFNKRTGYEHSHVPNTPTTKQVEDSLKLLLKPFSGYPLRTPLDQGGLLAAILTAVIRPALDIAPGFMIDAPQAGSGKTKLAKSLAILAGSKSPSTMPPTYKEEETRKRILSVGREGGSTMLIDNIEDTYTSSALCTWLTSEEFADRELEQNTRLIVPTQVLCLLTGNNLRVGKDLRRRMIRIHIDPEMEMPWKRQFDFDPVDLCKKHRYAMNAAALTLIRAGGDLLGDKKRESDFPAWQRLVCETVLWVGKQGLYEVEDPTLSFDWSYEQDYEKALGSDFFTAWYNEFNLQGKTLREAFDGIKQGWSNGKGNELFEVACEITGGGESINIRKLGKWMSKRQGKVYDNLKLIVADKKSGRHNVWKLCEV